MKRAFVLILVAVLLLTAAGCSKPKDIMTQAGIKSLDGLLVTDGQNRTVAVTTTLDAFTQAFATAVYDAKGNDLGLNPSAADYQLAAQGRKFYYFKTPGRLLYMDAKNRQYVYAAQLDGLLAPLFAVTPPPATTPTVKVSTGAPNEEVAALAQVLAEVKSPTAYLLEHGQQTVLVFAAGQKPTAGYKVEVDDIAQPARNFVVSFRVEAPSGSAATVISYPYAVLTFDAKVEAVVRTLEGTQVKEWPVIKVAEGQNVILLQPRSGALLTERVTLVGKARVEGGDLSVQIEDGHYVLGEVSFKVSRAAPAWGDFEVRLDLKAPTNLHGAIIFFTGSSAKGTRVEHLLVPVTFTGGK